MRIGFVVLGIGLILLWLASLSVRGTTWLTWLDFAAGILSLMAAGTLTREQGAMPLASTLAIAVSLMILWVVGLATDASPWLAWWTFAFACAYLILGIGAGPTERQQTPQTL